MRVSDFDFDLPESHIALRPAVPREAARLLVVGDDGLDDRHIGDLPDLLRRGDVLIVNDTRVLPVQLIGTRARDRITAGFEATLIKALGPTHWQAFIKPGRRVRPGDILRFGDDGALTCDVKAKSEDGIFELSFHQPADAMMAGLQAVGAMPLPPYIRSLRREDAQDASDYQTIFADEAGSVAAPTAGLHFTPALIDRLKAKDVQFERVTLHVGAGTFLPIKVDDTRDHVMHAEYGVVDAATVDRLNQARTEGRRLISVGTTSLRLLESACNSQGIFTPFAAETSIFITPGVKVQSCDLLMTNFHLPKSTLFMLVCALSGTERMKAAYGHAIETGYRFFSYGDACLLPNISRNPPALP
jgi:S-adenosylmethionine:tRNA ribosyltransferase-isomerase